MEQKPAFWTEPLGAGFQMAVSREHRLWTDTVLLAHFSAPKAGERACDLGAGCGSIPLIWLRGDVPGSVTAVEIQQEACELMEKSIALNHLEQRLRVVCSDLRELKGKVPAGEFDIVVCNPPYKAERAGLQSPVDAKAAARNETLCSFDDIAAAASGLLRFGGRFCLCQRPERLCDVTAALRAHGMEPKRLRIVQQRPNKEPKLFLMEARRGGKPGGLRMEPVLMIEGTEGGFSQEMLEIYGEYKEGYL